ncbi:Histone transcription regulator HIRA, WD repeat superfamily [Phaffia rhodozyma]|uniref:Protein HIR n=1 Tax=Phaffia rhodozyma TaxID=264483 RepID=A0A0F7SV95_PHARH|nr:Histone transcription regulator HIRA, WD repeat superfamily [Phaffia rhodozyma]
MKLIKPAWVKHEDAKSEGKRGRLPIYSVSVHPDGSRLATGSLDGKIRIWSTLPILDEEVEKNESNPRLLCTMTQHDGPVLCVRWAHHGRFLASGSDDKIVVIWDLDPVGGGRIFGSTDVNVETWKPLQRLVGHSSDVVDLAWSRDDAMLATVGLDSMVYVWNTATFQIIKKIAQHEDFVKGVCWDPVGEYLATQSDDKSVKIWKTSDWTLQQTIKEPFVNSPGSTFFRRLSWSPDGAFIASSNAMNRAVFTAAVIQRHGWKQDICFVGHENTVEVTAFNPRVFIPKGEKLTRNRTSCMVALGSDDRSISIWKNNEPSPLLVVTECFDGKIWDLSWTTQGRTLYACSSDGSIACFDFTKKEISGFAQEGALEVVLSTYEHFRKHSQSKTDPVSQVVSRTPAPITTAVKTLIPRMTGKTSLAEQSNPISSTLPVPVPVPLTQTITMKNGKKRIQPTMLQTGSSIVGVNQAVFGNSQAPPAISSSSSTLGVPPQMPSTSSANPGMRDIEMRTDVEQSGLSLNGKRKASGDLSELKARTRTMMGGDDLERDLRSARPEMSFVNLDQTRTGGNVLPIPSIKALLSAKFSDNADSPKIEVRNTNTGPIEISARSSNKIIWSDYLSSPVISVVATMFFAALSCEDGTLTVYSLQGRRILPTLFLDGPCSILEASKTGLSAVTALGTMYNWNIKTKTAIYASAQPNISTILRPLTSTSTKRPTIFRSSLRSNHAHVFVLSNGRALTFCQHLACWIVLSSRWWSRGSDHWESSSDRTSRTSTIVHSKRVIPQLEASIGALINQQDSETDGVDDENLKEAGRVVRQVESSANDGPSSPISFTQAITLGHLESRLHASQALGVPVDEYASYLGTYAKRLAEQGNVEKVEELLEDLAVGSIGSGNMFGADRATLSGINKSTTHTSTLTPPPIIHASTSPRFGPGIVAGRKKDHLRDVLAVLSRCPSTTKISQDWQDTIRRLSKLDSFDEPF